MKRIFLLAFAFFVIIACEKIIDKTELPKAIQDRIAVMEIDDSFWGTKLYRYKWNNNYYYEFIIPISSCAHCEIYDSYGNKLQSPDFDVMKFVNERTDEMVVWEWAKKE